MSGRKSFVYPPQRTVTVEDGTVRDLDGNTLGEVKFLLTEGRGGWAYRPTTHVWPNDVLYPTRKAAVFALVADEACPDESQNRYDKGEKR